MDFTITLQSVLTMLVYSVPGYLLVRTKKVSEKHISAFSAFLLYVLSPVLSVHAILQVEYSPEMFGQMALFFVLSAVIQIVPAAEIYLAVRKRTAEQSGRIVIISGVSGNVGFMGIPLLNALLPGHPEAAAFSAMFSLSMGIIAWTLGVAVLTGNPKHINLKKVFLNPVTVGTVIALPLFFAGVALPGAVEAPLALFAQMSTPVCMLILGMRFATVSVQEIFAERSIYPSAALKLILSPILAFAITYFLPIPDAMKASLIIMCACPTANVVLSLSELYGAGQKSSALLVLSSTLLSMITIPVMLHLLNV